MTVKALPYYLANRAAFANEDLEVIDKHTGSVAWRVAQADGAVVDEAIAAAVKATRPMAELPADRARDILLRCFGRCREGDEQLMGVLTVEGGKVRRDAKGEVTRLIETFKVAAEEAARIGGEVIPM